MKRIVIFSIIAIIIFIFFIAFFWLYEVQYKVGRASITSYSFSVDNSYIFVSPLRAKANNNEKIRLTVFILNNQGLGVGGKKINIANNKNISIEAIQGITDVYGKAFFDISSSIKGEYFLEVTIDGTALKQKAHLSFY
jgi:hypothetical protein